MELCGTDQQNKTTYLIHPCCFRYLNNFFCSSAVFCWQLHIIIYEQKSNSFTQISCNASCIYPVICLDVSSSFLHISYSALDFTVFLLSYFPLPLSLHLDMFRPLFPPHSSFLSLSASTFLYPLMCR